MFTTTDQMGRSLTLSHPPQRIISLVPSQTELLFDLGLEERIVGRTKFCIHPAEKVAAVPSVGGTKKFRFDVIAQLQPDLIIGNKEENYEEGIAQLAADYPVWMSDITTLEEALAMIKQVGLLVGQGERAEGLATEIAGRFGALQPLARPYRVGYFIWQKPYMAVGQPTFIHDLLGRCGFMNAFAEAGYGRYPELTAEEIRAAQLDMMLLSSEPFPFAETHQEAFTAEFGLPVHLVDGEMFSWYGGRLLRAADYLAELGAAVSEPPIFNPR